MPDQSVILFPTTAHVMRAEKLLGAAGLPCRLIPVPRHLSSDCGICIVLAGEHANDARTVLDDKQIDYDAIAEISFG